MRHPCLLSIALIKHHDQKQYGRKVFVLLTLPNYSSSWMKGRNLETGTEAEAMKKHPYWLVLPMACSVSSLCNPGPPAQRCTALVIWALPHQSLIKKMPHRHAYRKSDGGNSWVQPAWWHMLLIPAAGRLRQMDLEFEASWFTLWVPK